MRNQYTNSVPNNYNQTPCGYLNFKYFDSSTIFISERIYVTPQETDDFLTNFFSSKRFLLNPTFFRRVFPQCIETKCDSGNTIEGQKICLSKRHDAAIQLIWTMQEVAALGFKFRAQQALIRSDFEPLYQLEPIKTLPFHISSRVSPSHTARTPSGCDFKCACQTLLSCILCEKACLCATTQLSRETPERAPTLKQVCGVQCSVTCKSGLRNVKPHQPDAKLELIYLSMQNHDS